MQKKLKKSEELTQEIKALEATDTSKMTRLEFLIHDQKIRDCYWARRRAWEKEGDLPASTI